MARVVADLSCQVRPLPPFEGDNVCRCTADPSAPSNEPWSRSGDSCSAHETLQLRSSTQHPVHFSCVCRVVNEWISYSEKAAEQGHRGTFQVGVAPSRVGSARHPFIERTVFTLRRLSHMCGGGATWRRSVAPGGAGRPGADRKQIGSSLSSCQQSISLRLSLMPVSFLLLRHVQPYFWPNWRDRRTHSPERVVVSSPVDVDSAFFHPSVGVAHVFALFSRGYHC